MVAGIFYKYGIRFFNPDFAVGIVMKGKKAIKTGV
jgi:hypothetical protein